jgi:hypothetical protein
MTLGKVSWNRRLGIANCSSKNPYNWSITILRLQAYSPVYQQALVKRAIWG